MPFARSLLHLLNYRSPLLRTLVPSMALAYGIQAAFAVPAIYAQTERYYDISGSITYLACTGLSLYLPTIRIRQTAIISGAVKPEWLGPIASMAGGKAGPVGYNWRQFFLSFAVAVWATRLGTHLFRRILQQGSDSRFDKIKKKPVSFFGAWMAQATWVSLCLMPVLAVNSLPSTAFSTFSKFAVTDAIGLALWAGGFLFEVIADGQKNRWMEEKRDKKHSEDFLTRGLWSKSRHPNYFGETTLWTGIGVAAGGVLFSNAGQVGSGLAGAGALGKVMALAIAGVSPAFVLFLLLKVSGVPLSEKKYDKRYGDRNDYQEWKKNTPMFIPKL